MQPLLPFLLLLLLLLPIPALLLLLLIPLQILLCLLPMLLLRFLLLLSFWKVQGMLHRPRTQPCLSPPDATTRVERCQLWCCKTVTEQDRVPQLHQAAFSPWLELHYLQLLALAATP
jgi:hypothetical protein